MNQIFGNNFYRPIKINYVILIRTSCKKAAAINRKLKALIKKSFEITFKVLPFFMLK